ncbi:MAG TPA: TIGR01777 family oxidoreductase [Rubrobacteraceae bacterium]|nr:TIGR01777 family oxidoreductase [Rubrobacteraceae bacterium]
MKVLISGATGLIGLELVAALGSAGHGVTRLTRSPRGPEDVGWDPLAGKIDALRLGGHDAVVHLAGESIAEGRWNAAKKRRIMESRSQGTRLLAETISGLSERPGVLVSASGINYYGDRGDEVMTEESAPGSDFLAEVCKVWEASADPAREAGIRVVHPRMGIVLSPKGGALGRTLPIFKLGGGGRIGSGRQWWSWVSLADVVGAIVHALGNEALEGAVNVTSPNPLTNAQYTKVLGKVLNRPTVFPLPAPAARLALGEVADALLLASQRVRPARLEATGYEFRHPELEGALRHLLRK